MIVETHDNLQNPQRIKATRAVIYDDHGNALAIVVEYPTDPVTIFTSCLGQSDFEATLRNFGIYQTTIVEDVGVTQPIIR